MSGTAVWGTGCYCSSCDDCCEIHSSRQSLSHCHCWASPSPAACTTVHGAYEFEELRLRWRLQQAVEYAGLAQGDSKWKQAVDDGLSACESGATLFVYRGECEDMASGYENGGAVSSSCSFPEPSAASLYDMLHCQRDSSDEELLRGCLQEIGACRASHAGSTEDWRRRSQKFRCAKQAYDILKSPTLRAVYDLWGLDAASGVANFTKALESDMYSHGDLHVTRVPPSRSCAGHCVVVRYGQVAVLPCAVVAWVLREDQRLEVRMHADKRIRSAFVAASATLNDVWQKLTGRRAPRELRFLCNGEPIASDASLECHEPVIDVHVRVAACGGVVGGDSPVAAGAHGAIIRVGMEVLIGSNKGTVRYIGETHFAEGTWVGVEYVDALGKNDGSVGGERYFTCRKGHGVFAREQKVKVVPSQDLSRPPVRSPGGQPLDTVPEDDSKYYTPNAAQEELTVGSRVRVLWDGQDLAGVLRYAGPTNFKEGEWMGIELEERKGGNNGTVMGKVYFECPDKYGLFVRPKNVRLEGAPVPESSQSEARLSTSSKEAVKRKTKKSAKSQSLSVPNHMELLEELSKARAQASSALERAASMEDRLHEYEDRLKHAQSKDAGGWKEEHHEHSLDAIGGLQELLACRLLSMRIENEAEEQGCEQSGIYLSLGVSTLIRDCKTVMKNFKQWCQVMADACKEDGLSTEFWIENVKGPSFAGRKANVEYGGDLRRLTDVCRGMLKICSKGPGTISKCYECFLKAVRTRTAGAAVVRFEDRLMHRHPSGHQVFSFLVRVRGIICELRVYFEALSEKDETINRQLFHVHHDLLLEAAQRDDASAVKYELDEGVNPDLLTKSGYSSLAYAALHDNANMAEALLEARADPFLADSDGHIAVSRAVQLSKLDTAAVIIKSMARQCADYSKPLQLSNEAIVDVVRTWALLRTTDTADSEVGSLFEDIFVRTTGGLHVAIGIAAGAGLSEVVEVLLEAKAEPDDCCYGADGMRRSPLDFAAESGSVQAVRILRSHGSELERYRPDNACRYPENAKGDACKCMMSHIIKEDRYKQLDAFQEAWAPGNWANLAYVMRMAVESGSLGVARVALARGASAVDLASSAVSRFASLAVRKNEVELVSLLILGKADFSASGEAVHLVARCGSEEMLRLLIEAKCPVSEVDEWSCTPLHVAARTGRCEMVKILSTANSSTAKQELSEVAHEAAKSGRVQTLHTLNGLGLDVASMLAADGEVPLAAAAKAGQTETIIALMAMGANVNCRCDNNGNTPLHWAHSIDVIKMLLTFRADVMARNKVGQTPADMAQGEALRRYLWEEQKSISEKEEARMLTLLRHDADAHKSHGDGKMLYEAAAAGHVKLVCALAERGCSLSDSDEHGLTPMHLAARGGHAEVMRILHTNLCSLRPAEDKNGCRPAHEAARMGHRNVLVALNELGCDIVHPKTREGETPLFLAAAGCHTDIITLLGDLNADVNVQTLSRGTRPIHEAASSGQWNALSTLRTLLQLRADVSAKTKDGKLASDVAERSNVKSFLVSQQQLHSWKLTADLKAGPGCLSRVPTIVVLCEMMDLEKQQQIMEVLTTQAKKYLDIAKEKLEALPKIGFMIATDTGGFAEELREWASLPTTPSERDPPRLLLLDVNDEESFYEAQEGMEITRNAIVDFIDKFERKILPRKSLKRSLVGDLRKGPGFLNNAPTVVAFCESSSPEEQQAIVRAMEPFAQSYLDEQRANGEVCHPWGDAMPKIGLMVATAPGRAERLRKRMAMPSTSTQPKLMLVDYRDGGAYYEGPEGEITRDAVGQLLADYMARKIPKMQLLAGVGRTVSTQDLTLKVKPPDSGSLLAQKSGSWLGTASAPGLSVLQAQRAS